MSHKRTNPGASRAHGARIDRLAGGINPKTNRRPVGFQSPPNNILERLLAGTAAPHDPAGDFGWQFDQSRRRYRVRPFRWDDPSPASHHGERITILDRQTKTWWSGLPLLTALTPDGTWEDTDEWAADRISAEITRRVFKAYTGFGGEIE